MTIAEGRRKVQKTQASPLLLELTGRAIEWAGHPFVGLHHVRGHGTTQRFQIDKFRSFWLWDTGVLSVGPAPTRCTFLVPEEHDKLLTRGADVGMHLGFPELASAVYIMLGFHHKELTPRVRR